MILDLIPIGSLFAVSRESLCQQSGMKDREIRREIAQLNKQGHLIINNGNGYFIPDDSAEDKAEVEKYYRRERKKAIDLLARLKNIRLSLQTDENQLSLEDI